MKKLTKTFVIALVLICACSSIFAAAPAQNANVKAVRTIEELLPKERQAVKPSGWTYTKFYWDGVAYYGEVKITRSAVDFARIEAYISNGYYGEMFVFDVKINTVNFISRKKIEINGVTFESMQDDKSLCYIETF